MQVATMFLAASLSLVSVQEPLASSLRQAIWYDLQVNAMIGNGNWLGSLWYNAGSETEKDLHLDDLACSDGASRKHCQFTLLRDGGPKTVMGEVAPAKLSCTATLTLVGEDNEWAVLHAPPKKVGHSTTSMHCKPADS